MMDNDNVVPLKSSSNEPELPAHVRKLAARLEVLQELRQEISGQIAAVNAELLKEPFDSWYEAHGIDGGIADATHETMMMFWWAAADQARYAAFDPRTGYEPYDGKTDFDLTSEEILVICLHFLEAHMDNDEERLSPPVRQAIEAIRKLPTKMP
jgi:hypothetical protein